MRRLLSDEWDQYADPADFESGGEFDCELLPVDAFMRQKIPHGWVAATPRPTEYSIEPQRPMTAKEAARYHRRYGG